MNDLSKLTDNDLIFEIRRLREAMEGIKIEAES